MLDRARRWIRGDDLKERAEFVLARPFEDPPVDYQLAEIIARRAGSGAYFPPSVRASLGVPAVFRAVSLLSNVAGGLTLEAYRNGRKLDTIQAPGVVSRPNPFRTPREFVRDSVWSLATYGETILYVGARDPDGNVQSLIVTPAHEWNVSWENDLLGIRRYQWRGVDVDRSRVVHLTFAEEPGQPRGVGPLQLCGAAVSVSVAADEWAANYYAGGGVPSVVLRSDDDLTDQEAADLRAAWMAGAARTPRVISGPIEVKDFPINARDAQLTEARLSNVGEVARMFGIPGKLLEYGVPGSSLTYQNLAAVGDDLVRFCLAPGYLEPIEQHLSDLLTRSTIARFSVAELLRADILTRYNAYRIALGPDVPFLEADEVREQEGLAGSGPAYSPVPPAPASARPELQPDLAKQAGNA